MTTQISPCSPGPGLGDLPRLRCRNLKGVDRNRPTSLFRFRPVCNTACVSITHAINVAPEYQRASQSSSRARMPSNLERRAIVDLVPVTSPGKSIPNSLRNELIPQIVSKWLITDRSIERSLSDYNPLQAITLAFAALSRTGCLSLASSGNIASKPSSRGIGVWASPVESVRSTWL